MQGWGVLTSTKLSGGASSPCSRQRGPGFDANGRLVTCPTPGFWTLNSLNPTITSSFGMCVAVLALCNAFAGLIAWGLKVNPIVSNDSRVFTGSSPMAVKLAPIQQREA